MVNDRGKVEMLLRKLSPLLLVMMFLAISAHATSIANTYVSKTGAGSSNGTNCANAHDQSWIEDSANWGTGSTQVGPDTIIHICGTSTFGINVRGFRLRTDIQPGTLGHEIHFLFESGAIVESPCFSTDGGLQPEAGGYVVIDGGSNGIIRNTSNGMTGKTCNQDSRLIYAPNSPHVEIKNLHLTDTYVADPSVDGGPQNGSGIWAWGEGFSVHDNVCVNSGKCFEVVGNAGGSVSNMYFYNNDVSQAGWGMACAVYSSRVLTNLFIYNNHWHDYTNWDTPGGTGVHKNFIAHCFSTGSPLGKIQNAYIYNNVVSGNLGKASETTADLFLEASDTPWTDATGTAYIFNNIFGGTFSDGFGPAGGLVSVGTGNGHMILNNTFLGVNRTDGDIINMNPCCGAPAPTNVTVRNNVAQTGDHLLYLGTGTTITSIDYNTYADSRDFTRIGATEYTTFAAWKAVCACDAHSTFAQSTPLANLSSAGVPNSMFAGVGAGTNLSSIATGLLAPLASDAAGTLRPTGSTPWTTGAYQVNSGPIASFSPSSVAFGNQVVSTSSSPSAIILTNAGTTALNVSAVSITGTNSGDFSQTNNCVGSIAASGSCTINVTFTPLATGARSASVSVTDTAPGSPHTVALTGTGTAPAVTIAPPSVAFGNQAVGSSSSPAAITVTNSGTSTLTISSVTLTGSNPGDFSETDNCVGMIAAGMSCTVNATFTPTTTGARSASVSVADNAGGSPHTAPLTGTGTTPGASLAPGSLAFGSILVGASAGPQVLTLTNTGGATLTISSITLTGTNPGDFSRTTTCGGTLTAGSNCTISVTFTPTTTGARSASVSVADSAAGSPHTSTLSGTGTSLTPPITPASTAIILASVPSGTVGIPYPATSFSCIGGSPPCSGWSMVPLVPGLTLSATAGVLGGTPTMAGNFAPAITAKDAAGKSVSITLSLPISQATAPPAAGTPGAPGKTPATMSCVRTAGTNTYTCKVLTYK